MLELFVNISQIPQQTHEVIQASIAVYVNT